MIEYALLIMLGFCAGGLVAFLLAPTLWHRAVRLTTKRLESTMPMSLSEIEADKDLLRASYAVSIRRLETGLNKARDKSANQLVEISKLQMQIGELNSQIASLNAQLDERRNAANVFENTIRKRLPELEGMLATAKAALDDRAGEIEDSRAKLSRREEMLAMTQRAANLQQNEIRQLRETLERSGADTTGRFKRRPSQWGLEEYRSEYDRLNVELSKLREQLILAQERENRQISVLKTELQQLAERIMASAAPQEKRAPDWRDAEREARLQQEPPKPAPAYATPRPASDQAVMRPQPWRREPQPEPAQSPRQTRPLPERRADATTVGAPTIEATEAAPKIETTAAPKTDMAAAAVPNMTAPQAAPRAEVKSTAAISDEDVTRRPQQQGAQSTQDALNSLLNRRSRDNMSEPGATPATAPASQSVVTESKADPSASAAAEVSQSGKADAPKENGHASDSAATVSTAAPAAETQTPAIETRISSKVEPKLDQVFREILEGRAVARTEPTPAAREKDEAKAGTASVAGQDTSEDDAETRPAAETSSTKTLLDRLRVIQERQTG